VTLENGCNEAHIVETKVGMYGIIVRGKIGRMGGGGVALEREWSSMGFLVDLRSGNCKLGIANPGVLIR
jgi:hypothetical protein